MTTIFSLSVLMLAFVVQLIGLRTRLDVKQVIQILFFISVSLVVTYFVYLVVFQYIAWRDAGPPLSYFIPPYQSVWYVINYHFIRFGLYYLLSLGAALAFFFAARRLNKKFGYRFFENEEPYLAALSIFLLGNPAWNYAWIFYIGILLGVAVILSIVKGHLLKKSERFSLYWLWLPLAILIVVFKLAL